MTLKKERSIKNYLKSKAGSLPSIKQSSLRMAGSKTEVMNALFSSPNKRRSPAASPQMMNEVSSSIPPAYSTISQPNINLSDMSPYNESPKKLYQTESKKPRNHAAIAILSSGRIPLWDVVTQQVSQFEQRREQTFAKIHNRQRQHSFRHSLDMQMQDSERRDREIQEERVKEVEDMKIHVKAFKIHTKLQKQNHRI